MAADRAAEEKADKQMQNVSCKAYSEKKAKGIIGARSLFAKQVVEAFLDNEKRT